MSEKKVSEETLQSIPERVLKYLRGVGRNPVIRAQMQAKGFTKKDIDEGWSLLLATSFYVKPGEEPASKASDAFDEALRAIDGFDDSTLTIIDVSVARRAPTVAAELQDGLASASGMAAVPVVTTILDRIDAVEKRVAKGKKPSAEDLAALSVLDARGVTPAARQTLRGYLATVKGGVEAAALPDEAATAEAKEGELVALRKLYAWYREWSAVAKLALPRKADQIALGLATAKKSKVTKQ